MAPVSDVVPGGDGGQQQDAPMGGKPLVGIIYPPPEVRNIVDKTASFVARNGPEFESRIRQNEANNAKFNFLTPTDPYHAYYKHKVVEFREGKASEPGTAPLMGAAHGSSMIPQTPKTLAAKAPEPIVLKDPPPDMEFVADPPSISAYDLDVVKLTAQFVARNGRQFLTNLMNREQRNFQFDFLRPQHSLFNYFTKLVEQYTKILIPPKDLMSKLRKELETPVNSKDGVLGIVRYRAEWERQQERQKQKEEEAKEKERVAYASVDWHDFVVVETVDFQPTEIGNFPPPTTPEEVGARMLMEERFAAAPEPTGQVPVTFIGENLEEEEEIEEAPEPKKPIEVRPAPAVKAPDNEPNMELVDMEEESSDEEDDDDEEEITMDKKPTPAPPPIAAPPPINPEKVVIKRNYDPKATAPAAAPATGEEQLLISPLTGEKIPASKMAEHMRIGLLDPKWLEQKDRALQEKMQRTEVFAPGGSIDSSLRNMASRRTDIFGAGDEETDIGKKFGEEEELTGSDKVTWDGHSSSMEATARKARENISVEDQLRHLQQIKTVMGTDDVNKIGPSSTSSGPPPPMPPMSRPPGPPPGMPKPPVSAPPVRPPIVPPPFSPGPPRPPVPMPPRPPMGGGPPMGGPPMGGPPMGGPPMGMPPRPPMGMPPRPPMGMPPRPPMMPPMPIPSSDDEPPNKKAKSEDNLIPENIFLAQHPNPITIKVLVPHDPTKPEWSFKGQILSFTMPPTDTFAVIKNKIMEATTMPIGKQKLQVDGIFTKDSNTLAFYNLTNNAQVMLSLKERGGRKK